MIRKHIDIVAILLMLLGFGAYTQARFCVQRAAMERVMWNRVRPAEVQIRPFRLNRFQQRLRQLSRSQVRFI